MAPNTATAAMTAGAAAVGLYMPQTYSFLSPETFETLVEGYINQLHIRKRNKALINQQLANDCLMVLTNPENTAIFNPKFRWWVRKHFVFTVVGELRILMDKKNGKPVCVREQLYDKVCYFHHIIGHGGRDKTFAAITKSYSKVPAELVSLFTKNCQTCLGVRKYSKNKRPILSEFEYPSHQQTPPPQQQQQQHHHQQQQQHQHLQQPHHHHHHPHLQLTCNTSGFSTNGQHTSMHTMMKPEHGTISPISPILNHTASSFFGSNHIHSAYSQAAAAAAAVHHQQQQQQHQLQQHHHAALATHLNMSMSLSDMSLGGHYDNNNGNHGFPSPSTTTSTPTVLTKLELPLHQLMQQHNQGLINTGLQSPTDMPDHHFTAQHQMSSPTCSSVDAYSPTLQEQYLHHHQQQQHHHQSQQQQSNDYSHPFSSYSTAAAVAALSLNSFQQHPGFQSHSQHQESSPILSQAQLFHKQIQQEHQRYQQEQQHRFLPSVMMTSSSVASAVPSMSNCMVSSTPSSSTTTTTFPLSTLLDDQDEHARRVQEELEKCQLNAVAELVAAAQL